MLRLPSLRLPRLCGFRSLFRLEGSALIASTHVWRSLTLLGGNLFVVHFVSLTYRSGQNLWYVPLMLYRKIPIWQFDRLALMPKLSKSQVLWSWQTTQKHELPLLHHLLSIFPNLHLLSFPLYLHPLPHLAILLLCQPHLSTLIHHWCLTLVLMLVVHLFMALTFHILWHLVGSEWLSHLSCQSGFQLVILGGVELMGITSASTYLGLICSKSIVSVTWGISLWLSWWRLILILVQTHPVSRCLRAQLYVCLGMSWRILGTLMGLPGLEVACGVPTYPIWVSILR